LVAAIGDIPGERFVMHVQGWIEPAKCISTGSETSRIDKGYNPCHRGSRHRGAADTGITSSDYYYEKCARHAEVWVASATPPVSLYGSYGSPVDLREIAVHSGFLPIGYIIDSRETTTAGDVTILVVLGNNFGSFILDALFQRRKESD
jgi:hypothetical protein